MPGRPSRRRQAGPLRAWRSGAAPCGVDRMGREVTWSGCPRDGPRPGERAPARPPIIVRCSACTTRYRIDPAALGVAGRRLRCTRCGHVWQEPPSAGAVAAPQSSDTTAPPAPSLPPRRRGPPGAAGLRPGWSSRSCWPGSRSRATRSSIPGHDTVRAYDAVGLWIALPRADGLRVVDVESERVRDGDRTVLLVRGFVENEAGERRTLPALRAVLRGRLGHRTPALAGGGAVAGSARRRDHDLRGLAREPAGRPRRGSRSTSPPPTGSDAARRGGSALKRARTGPGRAPAGSRGPGAAGSRPAHRRAP